MNNERINVHASRHSGSSDLQLTYALVADSYTFQYTARYIDLLPDMV